MAVTINARDSLDQTTGLRVISGAALPPQLHVQRWGGAAPSAGRSRPVRNRPVQDKGSRCEPAEGPLWTADVIPGGSSSFLDLFAHFFLVHYTRAQYVRGLGGIWRLLPDPGAQLLLVDSAMDWLTIQRRYGRRETGGDRIDWEALAADGWDGVYLTANGERACRVWQLQSTVWMRWAFTGALVRVDPESIRYTASGEIRGWGDGVEAGLCTVTYTPAWMFRADLPLYAIVAAKLCQIPAEPNKWEPEARMISILYELAWLLFLDWECTAPGARASKPASLDRMKNVDPRQLLQMIGIAWRDLQGRCATMHGFAWSTTPSSE